MSVVNPFFKAGWFRVFTATLVDMVEQLDRAVPLCHGKRRTTRLQEHREAPRPVCVCEEFE
jgi:hypothetical protein